MSLDPEHLRERIVALEIEHRDLDEAIVRLADLPNRDDLLVTRLKKRKLQLKDQILQLKMLLFLISLPDDLPHFDRNTCHHRFCRYP